MFNRSILLLALCSLASLTAGCFSMTKVAGDRFMAEYSCPNAFVKELSPTSVRVRGCGRVDTFYCDEGKCIKESTRADDVVAASQGGTSQVSSAQSQGNKAVQASFKRKEGSLTFTAVPVSVPDEVRLEANLGASCTDCQTRLAIDGNPVAVTYEAASQQPQNSYQAKLTLEMVAQMVSSDKTTFRFGGADWEVSAEDKAKLKEFVLICRQEQALSGEVVKPAGEATPNQQL
jgi:hypothetical protein